VDVRLDYLDLAVLLAAINEVLQSEFGGSNKREEIEIVKILLLSQQ